METRAHHILIGLFTLLVGGAAMLFALWLGKTSMDNNYDNYQVVFEESVSGLSTGSPVRFSGIKVGEVVQLRLDDEDPSKVLATIRVGASTPVRENTTAKLSLSGVTGTAFIQLGSGEGSSPPLTSKNGKLPQIMAEPSSISRLFADSSELFNKVSELMDSANKMFSAQNAENISKILANLEQTSSAISAQRDDLKLMFADFSRLTTEANKSLEQATQLMATGNRLLDEHGSATLNDLQQTMAALKRSSNNVDILLQQNQVPINQGLQSLGNLEPALQELRDTLASLRSISQRIEANPAAYLLGREPREEFQP